MGIQRQQTPEAMEAKTVCVTLESLQVNHLYSKDWGRRKQREGVVEIKVSGQPSTLSWATNSRGLLKNPGKFNGSIVYVGRGENPLDTQLAVIETDRAKFSEFRGKASKVISFVKAISVFAPPCAPAVAVAGDFAELLMKIGASMVDDDLELAFHGGLMSDMTVGPISQPDFGLLGYTRVSRPAPGGASPGVECEFRTWELPTLPLDREISLYLDVLELVPKPSVKQDKLLFEATFGGGKQAQTFKFECDTHAEKLFPIVDGKLLYKGEWSGFLPFQINVVAMDNEDRQAMHAVVQEAVPLLERVAQLRGMPAEEVKAKVSTVQNACKALQSLEALAAEFIKDKMTVATLSGVLARDDGSGNASLPRVCQAIAPKGTADLAASAVAGGRVALKVRLAEGPPIPKQKPAHANTSR